MFLAPGAPERHFNPLKAPCHENLFQRVFNTSVAKIHESTRAVILSDTRGNT